VLEGELSKNGLAQRKALIRFHFGVVPTTLDELAEMWGQLAFALEFHGKLKIEEPKKG
jgi:hypothetical protein